MPPLTNVGWIEVHLDEVLQQRNMTLTELAKRIGLTQANLSILKTGKAKAVRFSTLAAVCAELECQPGDILTFSSKATSDRNDVILYDPGDKPIAVIKVLREELRLGLKPAKELVDSAPTVVAENLKRLDAELFMNKLRRAGANASVS